MLVPRVVQPSRRLQPSHPLQPTGRASPAAGSRPIAWRLLNPPVCTCSGRGRGRCAKAMSRGQEAPGASHQLPLGLSWLGNRPEAMEDTALQGQGAVGPVRREECLSHRHSMKWAYSSSGKGPRPRSSGLPTNRTMMCHTCEGFGLLFTYF